LLFNFSAVHNSNTLNILFIQGIPYLYAIPMPYCTCTVQYNLFACCRSADQNQPRETMEQHLLAYLTNKYGVRQLITQWLTSILAAIEHFSPLDAQTALFGKVLRNEVEEEFEEAQLRVKTTASSLLQSILQVILGCRVTIHQMCMLALASLWSHRIGKGCQIIQSNLTCHSKGDLQL